MSKRSIGMQNCSLTEAARLIREGELSISDDEASRIRLAEWLEELHHSRNAIDNVRYALANPEATVVLPENWSKKQHRIGH